MRVVHLLRKYNPAEWGGTETALQNLFEGLHPTGITAIVYCPRTDAVAAHDPLAEAGIAIKHFRACVPIWGISRQHKRQHIAVGGNLLSFDLIANLFRERNISLVHSHTLGRLGGIGLTVAKRRRIPFVVTIHGGVMDLPEGLRKRLNESRFRGWEWGKLFGALVQSRRVLVDADAILTCNEKEAALLQRKFPGKRVQVQPHGVPTRLFQTDHRAAARAAFPQICNRQMLLVVGRIDPVKNQGWLVERAPAILLKHPQAVLVLAGACTDETYGQAIRTQIGDLGLPDRVVLTGGLRPGDPRLIGLFQEAAIVILPSMAETFGIVILEAWAAGKPVMSSRTSGAMSLIKERENGWLFDLEYAPTFHEALDQALEDPTLAAQFAEAGRELARSEYDVVILAGRIKNLYEQLVEEKHALRHHSR